jgi:hypothetical protein
VRRFYGRKLNIDRSLSHTPKHLPNYCDHLSKYLHIQLVSEHNVWLQHAFILILKKVCAHHTQSPLTCPTFMYYTSTKSVCLSFRTCLRNVVCTTRKEIRVAIVQLVYNNVWIMALDSTYQERLLPMPVVCPFLEKCHINISHVFIFRHHARLSLWYQLDGMRCAIPEWKCIRAHAIKNTPTDMRLAWVKNDTVPSR